MLLCCYILHHCTTIECSSAVPLFGMPLCQHPFYSGDLPREQSWGILSVRYIDVQNLKQPAMCGPPLTRKMAFYQIPYWQNKIWFLACLGSRVTFHVSSVCSLNRMSVCQWSKSALPLPPPPAHHGRCPLPLLLLCHMSGALIKKARFKTTQLSQPKRLISLISSHQVKKKQLRSIFGRK